MFTKSLAAALLLANTQAATTVQKVEMAEFMQGVVKSYGGDFNLEALLACIGEEDKAALIFDAAYTQFETYEQSKNLQDLIPVAFLLFAGVKQAQQGLPACEAVDTSKWNYAALKSDMKFNLANMSAHEAEIVENMTAALKEYTQKDFVAMGNTFSNILKFNENTTDLKYVQERIHTEKAERLDRKDTASFVQGFFEGAKVGTFNFTALLECIYEADQEAEVLDTGVHMLIRAYEDKSIQEAIPAVIAGVAFVQGLKQTIGMCSQVDPSTKSWTTFDNIVNTLESPENHMTVIGENIMMNHKDITKEMTESLNSWRSGDYFTFGKTLATTMKDTCEPEAPLFLY